jgi:hemoglobin
VFTSTLLGYATKDDLLGRFWANGGDDHLARERQLLIDFLVKETGGDMYYRGRDIELSHRGMGINEADWTRFIEIVTKVAGELGVGPTEGGEVMAFLDSLKTDVVTA